MGLHNKIRYVLFARQGSVRSFLWQSRSIRWGYYRSVFFIRYWWRQRQFPKLRDGRRAKIAFVPEMPGTGHVVSKICVVSGFRIQDHLTDDPDLVIRWDDSTFPKGDESLNQFAGRARIINRNLSDISKYKLDVAHVDVFGYGVNIDPRSFRGVGVKKSDQNARHDGQLIEFPIENVDPAYVYQRCIDNQVDDVYVQDIRVPVFDDAIPFVYLRHRPARDRFGVAGNEFSLIAETDEMLTAEEQQRIISLCRKMGLDFGELDALRDRQDGRLYVVDLNNTPSGPVKGLSPDDYWRAVQRLTSAFTATYLPSKTVVSR